MVERLVRAAEAADDRRLLAQDPPPEAYNRLPVALIPRHLRVFGEALEARDHLIRLRHAVFVHRDHVVIGEIEQVLMQRPAEGDDVLGEIEIALLVRDVVQHHERLEDRAAVEPVPVAGAGGDDLLPVLLAPDMVRDVVGVPHERRDDPVGELIVPADVEKIDEAEHYILPAPEIPSPELGFRRIGREPPELILRPEHVTYRRLENRVELVVPRQGGIGEAGAAHHLAPVLAPPSGVCVVDAGMPEQSDEFLPDRDVEKLDPAHGGKLG